MKRGKIKFSVDERLVEVPMVCRQSDIIRARKLAEDLKKRVTDGSFDLGGC